MAGTWTSAILAGIADIAGILTSTTLAESGYYGRNWANYEHETFLGIFFFSQQERIEWVVFCGMSSCQRERLMWVWEEK
jgi:hypothetical protein